MPKAVPLTRREHSPHPGGNRKVRSSTPEKMGREVLILLPLTVSGWSTAHQEFMDFSGMSHEEALVGARNSIERYTTVGQPLFLRTTCTRGLLNSLAHWRAAGIPSTCVASQGPNPEPSVQRIPDHFGMMGLF